jgi:hypothetical protein
MEQEGAFPTEFEAAIGERLRLAATVHERKPCPTCNAPTGKRCRSMPRGYRPLDLPGQGARELKRSHPRRLQLEGLDR